MIFAVGVACVCTREGNDQEKITPSPRPAVTGAAQAFTLDKALAAGDLTEFTKAPHAFGSERQAQLADFIERRATERGARVVRQAFTATVPNPAALDAVGPAQYTLEKQGVNLWAFDVTRPTGDAPCIVAMGSHYDTKEIEGLRYVGANDSGSSSIALLQLAAQVEAALAASTDLVAACDLAFVWFDGEEALLPNWSDGETRHPAKLQDNTYGSRHAAGLLTECKFDGAPAKCLPADLGGKPLVALVLLDMIGSPNLRLSLDSHSTASLTALAAEAAAALGAPEAYDKVAKAVEDDHIPFINAGVAAVDLIDFNNLDYWHRPGDEIANISFESIELASRIGLYVALAVASEPKVFLRASE